MTEATTPQQDGPLLLDMETTAAQLSMSRSRLYELLGCGALVSVKLGRRRYVRRTDLEEYVASLTEEIPA